MDCKNDDTLEILEKIIKESYDKGYKAAESKQKEIVMCSWIVAKCIDEYIPEEYKQEALRKEAAQKLGEFIIDNKLCVMEDCKAYGGLGIKYTVGIVKPGG